MRDDDDREAELLVDVGDEAQDGLRRLWVERARRLVAEQHARVARERARDADALLLPAGELRGVLVRLVREADEVEELRDLRADGVLRRAREAQRECDVVVDGGGAQQVEMLEDHADVLAHGAQLAAIHGREVAPVDLDRAARRPFEHVDATDQRRFARAGEADDAEDLTARDLQADVLERVHGAGRTVIRLDDMRELDQ